MSNLKCTVLFCAVDPCVTPLCQSCASYVIRLRIFQLNQMRKCLQHNCLECSRLFIKHSYEQRNVILALEVALSIFSPRNEVQGTQQSAFSVRYVCGFVGLLTASDWSK